jgi:hypothetical protein
MEGLWYAHFTAGQAHGDGIAVLRDGAILGGDPAHTYTGSYQSDGPNFYANVRVSPYAAAKVPSNLAQPLKVFLKGSMTGDSATISGHPEQKADLKIAVEMHRAS